MKKIGEKVTRAQTRRGAARPGGQRDGGAARPGAAVARGAARPRAPDAQRQAAAAADDRPGHVVGHSRRIPVGEPLGVVARRVPDLSASARDHQRRLLRLIPHSTRKPAGVRGEAGADIRRAQSSGETSRPVPAHRRLGEARTDPQREDGHAEAVRVEAAERLDRRLGQAVVGVRPGNDIRRYADRPVRRRLAGTGTRAGAGRQLQPGSGLLPAGSGLLPAWR